MRSVRTASAAALLGSVLCLVSCFGHHTADEEVLKGGPDGDEDPSTADDIVQEEDDEDEDDRPSGGGGGGQPRDAGRDAGRTNDAGACAGITDPIEATLCAAGLGGLGIDGIIDGILGGGGDIGGIIDGILGGGGRDAGTPRRDAGTPRSDAGTSRDAGTRDAGAGRDGGVASDAGVDRAAFVAAIQRILEDLITALFTGGGFPTRNAVLAPPADDKSRGDALTRSSEQCAEATREDLLTRLICARQALDEALAAE